MVDDFSPMRMQKKTRSASICATSGGSIETAIHNMPPYGAASGSATPESGGTPGYRRRRPATRSQSARITTGAKSVRRRAQAQAQQQQQQQYNLENARSYCTSEPRLSETETPPQRRKLSQRRPQQHAQRKSNAFLDVPAMHHLRVSDDDEDLDRLRTFSASKGGVINRGDSFRRRRSRSNSLAPVSPIHPRLGGGGGIGGSVGGGINGDYTGAQDEPQQQQPVEVFRVEMLGASGVGKQALIQQFRTSDCINAYDGPECDVAEQNISIILNGIESELKFSTGQQDNKDELEKADAFLVIYSCIDKESFTRAKHILSRLQDMDLIRTRPIILVANKIDLARSRAVSSQDGKCVACTFGAKFIEVSAGINHNCDDLLAGTLTQIRLKKDQNLLHNPDGTSRTGSKKSKDKHKDKDNNKIKEKEKVIDKALEHNGADCVNEKNSENLGNRDGASSPAHWYKSRSVVLASMKARQMLTWILGKEDSKFKNCENLQVL
ncbi:GTP-binding protein RAD isoform X1 [Bactrocera dorsalis]|uniref:GTP-binding protein RAD isoform X1 n=2 Tax=Bactrocera TaxID=47832 RepID=A0ABM3JKL2_BACDO|nr:GTP-binding protein RAD isoform X1 [Bactrocera dorsalis]XP_049309774.1 GTP-binding protein RAD isoform X1 [Bactrocera dorsalis]